MPTYQLRVSKSDAEKEVLHIITQLHDFRHAMDTQVIHTTIMEFEKWRRSARKILIKLFVSNIFADELFQETKAFENKFSDAETRNNVKKAMTNGLEILRIVQEELSKAVPNEKHVRDQNDISKDMAITIIRKLLSNFYKHIEVMYQSPPHKCGTIKLEDLEKIQIGNEYDVQRMIYSLIKPLFPHARMEVVDDTGYGSIRYDVTLDDYGIIIEVKCTRAGMKERDLTEELGSDSFHYKADHLFLFIVDRVKLLKNPEAFKKTFQRDKDSFGKEVETIILQPVMI